MDKKEEAFRKKLLATFKVEGAEHWQSLSSGLVELEGAADAGARQAIIETVFRCVHSLKGAARAVGVAGIEAVCQPMESLFAALKRRDIDPSPMLFDVLNDAVDVLRTQLAALDAAATTPAPPTGALVARLDDAVKGRLKPREQARANVPDERRVLTDTVRIATAKLDAMLRQTEELLSAKLAVSERAAEIRDIEREFLTLEGSLVSPAFANAVDPGSAPRSGGESVEGPANLLKPFKARLRALAADTDRDQRALGTMVDGLLDDMKKALMLPVSTAFEVLPRMVRELSRDQGKDIDLKMNGAEIEIDRRILEQVRDPLVHLVRNCVDHGIESAEDRRRGKKSARGTVTLSVTQKSSSSIEIVVADDGRGIDIEKVRDAARKAGFVSQQGADTLDEQTALSLVFQSGVSTSPIITDLSGRGVGLAIVREKVEGLGGLVSVESRADRGSTFRITLPLTLSTFRGVHVRVGDYRFVIPIAHVEQVIRVNRDEIATVENRETIPWRGRAVSLVALADVLEIARGPGVDSANDIVHAVILSGSGREIAFSVDEIIGEQEVLAKPLGRQLPRVRNIAGVTMLGIGKVVPLLNVADLLQSAVKGVGTPMKRAMPEDETTVEKSILVAEDSITARALVKNILETAGYRVKTAFDGVDALTQLKTERFDLVVSDVEMPRMDGFDLTERIRADKVLAQLPVVLVTALESREHRERGVDAGASAYIVKSSFDQSNLLGVIRRLI